MLQFGVSNRRDTRSPMLSTMSAKLSRFATPSWMVVRTAISALRRAISRSSRDAAPLPVAARRGRRSGEGGALGAAGLRVACDRVVRDPARERAVPPAGFFFRGVAVFLRDDTTIASSLAAVSGAQVYRVTAPAASRTVGAHRAEAERTAASGRVGTSSRALAALSDTSAAAVIAP